MRFEKKNIVVTGAAAGMGKEITSRYLAEGANVLAVDRSERRGAAGTGRGINLQECCYNP